MANLLESILGPAVMAYGLARSSSRNRGNYSGNGLISQMLAKAEKQKEYDQQIAKMNRAADLRILADTIAKSMQTGTPSVYTDELYANNPELQSLSAAERMANAQFNSKSTPTIEALVSRGIPVPEGYLDAGTIEARKMALAQSDMVDAFRRAGLTDAVLANLTQPHAVAAAQGAGADFGNISNDPAGLLSILGKGMIDAGKAGSGTGGGGVAQPKPPMPKDYANVGKSFFEYVMKLSDNTDFDISAMRNDRNSFLEAVPTITSALGMQMAMNGMENNAQNRAMVIANAGVPMGLTPREINQTIEAVEMYSKNPDTFFGAPGASETDGTSDADTEGVSGLSLNDYIRMRNGSHAREEILNDVLSKGRVTSGGQRNAIMAELDKYEASYQKNSK